MLYLGSSAEEQSRKMAAGSNPAQDFFTPR